MKELSQQGGLQEYLIHVCFVCITLFWAFSLFAHCFVTDSALSLSKYWLIWSSHYPYEESTGVNQWGNWGTVAKQLAQSCIPGIVAGIWVPWAKAPCLIGTWFHSSWMNKCVPPMFDFPLWQPPAWENSPYLQICSVGNLTYHQDISVEQFVFRCCFLWYLTTCHFA